MKNQRKTGEAKDIETDRLWGLGVSAGRHGGRQKAFEGAQLTDVILAVLGAQFNAVPVTGALVTSNSRHNASRTLMM